MRGWLRWTDRVLGAFVLLLAVTSTIGCVVVLVARDWSRLPVQLLFAAVFDFLVYARRPDARGRFVSARRMRSNNLPAGAALTRMRSLVLAFTGALASFALVIATLPDSSRGTPLPWVLALVVVAAWSVTLSRVVEKPLDCTSVATLLESYRTRFFLRLALAEAIALFAFTFTFLGAPRWIYYLGGAVAVARLWTRAAPSRAALTRDQEALDARGCDLSLEAVLAAGTVPE